MNNKISVTFLVLYITTSVQASNLESIDQQHKNSPKILYAKDLISFNNKLTPKLQLLASTVSTLCFLSAWVICLYSIMDRTTNTNMIDRIPWGIMSVLIFDLTVERLGYVISDLSELNFKRKFSALEEIVEKLANERPKIENENYDRECLVCLEAGENPLYISCYCGHYYHEHCLKTWLNQADKNRKEDIFKCIKCEKKLNKLVLSNPD